MNRRLTPFMETALRALGAGALEWTDDGWRSPRGIPGRWNSHTLSYLRRLGYCAIVKHKRASITRDGREALNFLEGRAA